MSPLDDELRRVLAAHADDTALQTDPLAGIEREATSIRRRRTGTAVLGAVLSIALVVLAVPSLRGGLDTDKGPDHVAGTPSATPSTAPDGLTVDATHPPNVYPWHRDVPATETQATVRAWRQFHPEVGAIGGQGLWSGTVEGLTGRVVALQLWARGDAGDEDARTVFAVIDRSGTARVFHDQLTFFREGAPGEPASATKYDVQRSTFDLAVLMTSLYDQPRLKQFWVVVTPPDITSVKLSMGEGVVLDTGSGGSGAQLAERSGGITTMRGETTAYEGEVGEAPISLIAGDPLTWPTQGVAAHNGQPADDDLYQQTHAALQSRFSDLVATSVLAVADDPQGQVALVIGEYERHGYGSNDAAYVIGAWIKPFGGTAQLVGLHDAPWGIESANARVPDNSSLGHGLVLAVGGPGWGVEYRTDAHAANTDTVVPFIAVAPQPGKDQGIFSMASVNGTKVVVANDLGRGLTFPDV
jgi:hypothetical protein